VARHFRDDEDPFKQKMRLRSRGYKSSGTKKCGDPLARVPAYFCPKRWGRARAKANWK